MRQFHSPNVFSFVILKQFAFVPHDALHLCYSSLANKCSDPELDVGELRCTMSVLHEMLWWIANFGAKTRCLEKLELALLSDFFAETLGKVSVYRVASWKQRIHNEGGWNKIYQGFKSPDRNEKFGSSAAKIQNDVVHPTIPPSKVMTSWEQAPSISKTAIIMGRLSLTPLPSSPTEPNQLETITLPNILEATFQPDRSSQFRKGPWRRIILTFRWGPPRSQKFNLAFHIFNVTIPSVPMRLSSDAWKCQRPTTRQYPIGRNTPVDKY